MATTKKHNNKWKLISRLSSLSEPYQHLDDLWNQWKLCDTIDLNNFPSTSARSKIINWNTHSFHNDDNRHDICLCSHAPIIMLNLMRNQYTNEQCVIGSCCIQKFATKDLKMEMKVKIGEHAGKRYCQICKRKLPDDIEYWKTCHKKCYLESKKSALRNLLNNSLNNSSDDSSEE